VLRVPRDPVQMWRACEGEVGGAGQRRSRRGDLAQAVAAVAFARMYQCSAAGQAHEKTLRLSPSAAGVFRKRVRQRVDSTRSRVTGSMGVVLSLSDTRQSWERPASYAPRNLPVRVMATRVPRLVVPLVQVQDQSGPRCRGQRACSPPSPCPRLVECSTAESG